MAAKNNPGVFDCYANAEADEPLFVLLARSPYSAALVNLYAMLKRMEQFRGATGDAEKILEAEQCANDMVAWRYANRPGRDDLAGVRTLAEAVALLAEVCGATLTIDPGPVAPEGQNQRYTVTVAPRAANAQFANGRSEVEAPAVDVQWWLAEVDQHGNPKLVDGMHRERAGADRAKFLIDAMHLSPGKRHKVARVELSDPVPNASGVDHTAVAAVNEARGIPA